MAVLELRYTDFIYLTEPTLLYILEQRNSDYVRRAMEQDQAISVQSHLQFCARLKERPLLKYFYVTLNGKPFGVCDFKAQGADWSQAEGGYYTFGDQPFSMEKVNGFAIWWMMEHYGLKGMCTKIKNTNRKALLPLYLKPHPSLRIVGKDAQYTYTANHFELAAVRADNRHLMQMHQIRTFFNNELFVDGTPNGTSNSTKNPNQR